jgi:hypothetical protein
MRSHRTKRVRTLIEERILKPFSVKTDKTPSAARRNANGSFDPSRRSLAMAKNELIRLSSLSARLTATVDGRSRHIVPLVPTGL